MQFREISWGQEMNGTDSWLCPKAGFDIDGAQPSDSKSRGSVGQIQDEYFY